MKKEIKLNTIIWIVLVVFICLSMLFSENGMSYSYLLITALSIVKFLSVGFQFMEVKHAHIVWKLVSITFVLVYFIGVLVLF